MKFVISQIQIYCENCDGYYSLERGQPIEDVDKLKTCPLCGSSTEIRKSQDYSSGLDFDNSFIQNMEKDERIEGKNYKERKKQMRNTKGGNAQKFHRIKEMLSDHDKEIWENLSIESKNKIIKGDKPRNRDLKDIVETYRDKGTFISYTFPDLELFEARKYIYNVGDLENVEIKKDDQDRTVVSVGYPTTRKIEE